MDSAPLVLKVLGEDSAVERDVFVDRFTELGVSVMRYFHYNKLR
jgi:hypothetical protein